VNRISMVNAKVVMTTTDAFSSCLRNLSIKDLPDLQYGTGNLPDPLQRVRKLSI